ncbi:YceD family protein [Thermonema rossianum]|uniref:YceD family protein n=1 Tax=Thermonema rossianum TaxID=55505 RepID=UPI0005715586|nr:DUF177 domain-containing protein [Thermonema rossianum]
MADYLKKYEIPVFHLKEQVYTYNFEDDDRFFACFENSLVEKGRFAAQLQLRKDRNMLHLQFRIKGSMRLVCDRSLDEFEYPFELERFHIVQFGDTETLESDDLTIVPSSTTAINVAHHIYEEICFAVPVKKLHPRYEQEEQQQEEDDDPLHNNSRLFYTTHSAEEKHQEQQSIDDEDIDPRWAILKKLKNNQNEN